jgi:uncharacterized protein (DUF1800 family)
MASLNLRQGVLGKRLAAHLLRRTTYHISPSRINEFATKTASQAVDQLFTIPALVHPEGPINWVDGVSPWLTADPYSNNPGNGTYQRRAVQVWIFNELMHDPSIRHKMAMFFHSIFITANDTDWRYFDHFRLFQLFATGNIKTLAYKVTLDSKMLRYLNNNVNYKYSPNENYAREFMELFTILKGEQIQTGNYTNYTEQDISEAARVLTGFKDSNFENKDSETGLATGYANYNLHDIGNKSFSAAFQHQTIVGAVNANDMYRELQDFIDMIFNQPETARAFCRRLYRFFVSDRITSEIESDIISPLASQLQTDGYEVSGVLKTLLKSVHFYDEDDSNSNDEVVGGKIKSPLELIFGSLNLFDANNIGVLNNSPTIYYSLQYQLLFRILDPMGFPEAPLSVEGYPGFFKSPDYSKSWIDQATIPHRYRLAYALLNGKTIKDNVTVPFKVDMPQYVAQNFSNPGYADELVTQLLEVCFAVMPDPDRYDYFKDKLLGSLSPANWYFEWHNYTVSGDDTAVKIALDNLFEAICSSPEFQTF